MPNDRGTTMERNDHDNNWQQMEWTTTTPLPTSSVGGFFFIHLIHSPFPCTSGKVGGLFFIYCAASMLAHRPLPVRSFILGLKYYLIYINSV
jgi:hypothetical protein